MKFRQILTSRIFTTTLAVFGLYEEAKALDVEACARDPITSKPEVINLLDPKGRKLLFTHKTNKSYETRPKPV